MLQSFALLLNANVEFLFEDADGSAVTAAANTGDTTGTWSSASYLIDGGSLNIGYTANNKSTHVNGNNTSDSFTLDSALTTGKHTFEVVLSGHDFTALDPAFGFDPFEIASSFSIIDSAGKSAIVGLKSSWFIPANSSISNIYSEDSGYSSAITDVYLNSYGRVEGGNTVSGITYSDLVMGVTPVTLQLEVDLDNGGTWTARAKWGTGDWVDLTQNGTGITDITSINIGTSFTNSTYSWGTNTADGVASNFVEVDSLSLSEFVAQSTADISINGTNWGTQSDANLTGTAVSSLIGDIDQKNTAPLTLQVVADLSSESGDWVSRYKLGTGEWVALVTDGTGLTDLNRFQLNVKTASPEAWGDSSITSPSTGDYIKVDSVKILTGSNFIKSSASADADYASPLLAIEFDDAAGTNLAPPNDNTATPDVDESDVTTVATAGSITGNFNFAGHLTDGNGNLNIGYTGDNQWVNNFQGSFRTFTFDNSLTSTTTGIAVFEVVISEYDLAKTWDSSNTIGSFDGKGLQVSVQNSLNAGAAINLFTDNKIVPNSVLQLDFDDVAGTALPSAAVYSALNYTGTWEFGGPQTDGEGNLNIGYSGLNRWTGIYGTSGTVYRTFVIDADPNQANNQAIETGRYVFETRINAADLSGSWKSADHLVSGKGMQIILRKADNSGAVLNFFSHIGSGDTGYQLKAQSNTWAGGGTTSGGGLKQAFGLSSTGAIDLQIRVNTDTGQWTTHAKSTSSDTWKDMELSGAGLTDIASIQIGVKTPLNDNGTPEDASDDSFYVWGDETLDGNAPEEYVDANDDGMFNPGVSNQSPSSSNLFSDSGDSSYPYAYTVAEPVIVALPQDASMSTGVSSNGSQIEFTWAGTDVDLESSEDLQTWTSVTNPANPIVATLSDAASKFYRLTVTGSGESSTGEQTIAIAVSDIPEGGANYRIITSDANGANVVQSDPVALTLGANTINVASASAERNVILWIDGDVTFTSLNKNSEAVFTAIPGETYTDTNKNGQRDAGNAPLVGDYIKVNYLRITQDLGSDPNNSIAAASKVAGTVTGTIAENVTVADSTSQTGSIKLKINANLASGAWTSAYSSDGTTWNDLVTDGGGLTSIANFTFGTKTHQYDAWGVVTAGGTASDNVTIDAISITDTDSATSLVAFDFNEVTGTWMKQNPGSAYGEAVNSGSNQGAWNFGGPRLQDGSLNIGYTSNWKWTAPSAEAPSFRKYVLTAPITSTDATNVEMLVDIDSYSLQRAWDNADQYNISSLSGKGMIFRLDASDADYATVEFATANAVDALLIAQDQDGDGQPDWFDPYPEDSTNGQAQTGIYVSQQFNEESATALNQTTDTGTLGTQWNFGGPRAANGNLNIGFPGGDDNYALMLGSTQGWRKKILTSDLTTGVVVLETVISAYDLSKSWSTSSTSSAEKGWRIVLTNGNTSGNQQGPIIALYTDANGGTEVYGSAFYGGDRIVFSEGDVRVDIGNATQASTAGLTFQIVCDLDTGLWYSRYKIGSGAWGNVNQYGAGFYNIDNIRISHKNASGDEWAASADATGDYVLIDRIQLLDRAILDSTIPLPADVVPSSLANQTADQLRALDPDEDGRIDQYEEFPNDKDNDGATSDVDADDNDASVQ